MMPPPAAGSRSNPNPSQEESPSQHNPLHFSSAPPDESSSVHTLQEGEGAAFKVQWVHAEAKDRQGF